MKKIAFIPHSERLKHHKLDYLKSINEYMEYPYQSEDGREIAPIQKILHDKCVELSGVKYWTFTNCCTDSLQIAIHCLTSPGDTILVPSYGWRAFANAVKFMNRKIHFIDIDETGNISLESLKDYNNKNTLPPAAILVVHNFGTIVNCSIIKNLIQSFGWVRTHIIEDAAPAFYMKEPYSYIPGSDSSVACFSFDFTKYPGTLGSGGAIATNNPDIYNKIYLCTSHGRNFDKEIVSIGTKSYLDNISCAVLVKEIELFEKFKYREKRNLIANWYKTNLPYAPIKGENYIWERYTIAVPPDKIDIVINSLNSIGCLAKTFFKEPLHKFPWLNDNKAICKITELFCSSTVMLPCHHFLTVEDLNKIKKVLE